MKIINIPPYKGLNYTPEKGRFIELELIDNMREKGQLEGVEMDLDDGPIIKELTELRDEEFLTKITVEAVKKVREYCEMDKYDAIITLGTMGMGFFASRMISKIPVVTAVHAGFYVASFIGDAFTLIEATDPQALIARHWAQLYGVSHKLASVRHISISSTSMTKLIREYKKEQRIKVPQGRELIDNIVVQCKKAIEEDGADSLILGCTPLQCLEDEVRQRLDETGYNEIRLISEFSAAVEMAKVMVNLKLTQAPRAYPSNFLKAKPDFR